MRSNAIVFLGMTYPHGIIRHFVLLAVELQKYLQEYDFYFASTTGETDQNAWPIVRREFAANRIIATADFAGLIKEIESLLGDYERVIVHSGGGWGQTKHMIPLKRKYGKRLIHIVTTHSFHIGDKKRVPMSIFQHILYRLYSDCVIFQCRYAAEKFFYGSWFLKNARGAIIPLGVESYPEVSDIIPEKLCGHMRLANVLLDKDASKFIYLAGFRKGKRHIWLMDAIAPVLKSHKRTYLILCGRGDPKIIAKVNKIAEQNGVSDQVIIPGQIHRDAIPWVLQHSNCAIVPSEAETFGHNFVEPMFAKLPVIGTRVGIGREIIIDGETGFRFSLQNPNELRIAVRILAEDTGFAKNMGLKAFELISKKYRHSDVAKSLAGVYRKLLDK